MQRCGHSAGRWIRTASQLSLRPAGRQSVQSAPTTRAAGTAHLQHTGTAQQTQRSQRSPAPLRSSPTCPPVSHPTPLRSCKRPTSWRIQQAPDRAGCSRQQQQANHPTRQRLLAAVLVSGQAQPQLPATLRIALPASWGTSRVRQTLRCKSLCLALVPRQPPTISTRHRPTPAPRRQPRHQALRASAGCVASPWLAGSAPPAPLLRCCTKAAPLAAGCPSLPQAAKGRMWQSGRLVAVRLWCSARSLHSLRFRPWPAASRTGR